MWLFVKAKVHLFIDMIYSSCMEEMHDSFPIQLQKYLKDFYQG